MTDVVRKDMKFHVEAIIFDLDGTIVDSKEAYIGAAKTAFSAFGQKLPSQNIAFEIPKRFELGIPLDDLTQRIDVADFSEVYLKSYYAASAVKSKPFPRVTDTLEKLSTKSKLGLTTRRRVPKDEVMQQLSRIGLGKFFKAVLTGTDTRSPKPSPESVIECSIELDVEPRNCLVVGDSITDVEAGRNAGAKTVAVLSGIFSFYELRKANPNLTLENVTELPDFIK